nr:MULTISPECIES: NAD(P)/FAD-dependent oxidoreductase [unclassified Lentimonas]
MKRACCSQMNVNARKKDEFVTCRGDSLKAINFKRIESKRIPNLYFADGCLAIDGITGGYNFRAT